MNPQEAIAAKRDEQPEPAGVFEEAPGNQLSRRHTVLAKRREARAVARRNVGATVNGRHYDPSAREWFPHLVERLDASRPLVGIFDEGTPQQRVIYGKPTFRNVIAADGRHV